MRRRLDSLCFTATHTSLRTLSRRVYSICFVLEVATIFILQSAGDSFDKKIHRAVPSYSQRTALREKAATDAGVYVFQLLDEAGSAAATTTTDLLTSTVCPSDIPAKCIEAKLRLAFKFEHTKITTSASPRAVLLNH